MKIKVDGLNPGQEYIFQVRAVFSDSEPSDWSNRVAYTVGGDVTPPPNPVGVYANFNASTFVVFWDGSAAVAESDFETFAVEISPEESLNNSVIYYTKAQRFELSQDANLKAFGNIETTLYAKVYSVDTSGNVSSGTLASATNGPPQSVINLEAYFLGTDVNVSWDYPGDDDFKEFVIDFGKDDTYSQKLQKTTTVTTSSLSFEENAHSLDTDPSVYVRVYSKDTINQLSTPAETLAINPPPEAPTGVWDSSVVFGGVQSYIVNIGQLTGKPVDYKDTVVYVHSASTGGTVLQSWYGTDSTAFLDSATDYSERYISAAYRDVFNQIGSQSARIAATALNPVIVDTTPPPVVTAGFSATSAVSSADKSGQSVTVTFNWLGAVSDDLTGYKVKYVAYDTTPPDSSATGSIIDVPSLSGADSKSVSVDVVAGQRYAWWVASYDRLNNMSDWSAVQTHTAATDTSAPAAPTAPTFAARPNPENNVVVLSWTSSETQSDFNPAVGIGYYEARIATDALYTSSVQTQRSQSTNISFTVPTWSTTYYGKVRAVDTSGNTSVWTTDASQAVGANPAAAAASAAQSTANNKNTVFYAANASIPTAIKAGDIWFVTDQDYKIRIANAPGNLIGNWPDALIGNSALAASGINAGKITVGTLDAGRISAGSISAVKLSSTMAFLSQTLQVGDTADTRINIVAGATGVAGKIYSGNSGVYNNANTGFYLDGGGNFSLKDKLSFNGTTLTVAGVVNATSGNFSGYVTANNGMRFGKGVDGGTNDGIYIDANDYWYGNGNLSLGNGGITWNGTTLAVTGNLTAATGSFTGNVSIGDSGSLYVGSPTTGDRAVFNAGGLTVIKGSNSITLDAATGTLTANSANITGSVTATSGAIGGWTISSTNLGSSKPTDFDASVSLASVVGGFESYTHVSNVTENMLNVGDSVTFGGGATGTARVYEVVNSTTVKVESSGITHSGSGSVTRNQLYYGFSSDASGTAIPTLFFGATDTIGSNSALALNQTGIKFTNGDTIYSTPSGLKINSSNVIANSFYGTYIYGSSMRIGDQSDSSVALDEDYVLIGQNGSDQAYIQLVHNESTSTELTITNTGILNSIVSDNGLDVSGTDVNISATENLTLKSDKATDVSIVLDGLEVWKSPALETNWSNYGSAYQEAQYRKMPDGTVLLRGLVKYYTATATTGTIFTLPPGYRPGGGSGSRDLVFTVQCNGGSARIDAKTDGSVAVMSYDAGDAGFISLSGISFDTMA